MYSAELKTKFERARNVVKYCRICQKYLVNLRLEPGLLGLVAEDCLEIVKIVVEYDKMISLEGAKSLDESLAIQIFVAFCFPVVDKLHHLLVVLSAVCQCVAAYSTLV